MFNTNELLDRSVMLREFCIIYKATFLDITLEFRVKLESPVTLVSGKIFTRSLLFTIPIYRIFKFTCLNFDNYIKNYFYE